MNGLSIKRDYIKRCVFVLCLFGFIVMGAIGGCSNNGGGQNQAKPLTEHDFTNDDSLRGDPERGVIVIFLEHPDSEIPGGDTSEIGIDKIPLKYKRTLEHTFCWEDDDGEAGHFMELDDSDGDEVLRVEANGACITEIVEAGDYLMTVHHDGRIEDSHPIFIIPNTEDIEQARESDGFINRFKVVVSKILKGIQKVATKNAHAQSREENINTLLTTGSCFGCYLGGADLSNADLSYTNLGSANLFHAFLQGTDLSSADLSGADLTDADLPNANLSQAILISADLSGADLTNADLTFAELDLAILTNDTVLTGADLSDARWCNFDCICANPSIGTCVGCPSVGEVCTSP